MSEQEREDPQTFPKWIYWYRSKEREGIHACRDDSPHASASCYEHCGHDHMKPAYAFAGVRTDKGSSAENGVINGVARKLKNSQDHQDKQFKRVQEQVEAMQTSIKQTQEQAQNQANAMQTSIKQTQEQAQDQAKAVSYTHLRAHET